MFEYMHGQLVRSGSTPDFERTLFFRDGRLLGDGESWNEREALVDVHRELLRRGWVSEASVWAVVEISKSAEGWRMFRNIGEAANPLVGQVVYAFDDDSALVCSTGAPYLTQGTACPLLVHVVDIHGTIPREHAIRDLLWETDLCFTKTDVGFRLPLVLKIADAGALQSARSYSITGITL